MRQAVTTAFILALVLALAAVQAAAGQAREASIGYSVRVTREAPIFSQSDARSPVVGRARVGDVLVVVGKENAWYKVRLPAGRKLDPTGPDSGYIEVKSVAVAGPGGTPVPVSAGRPAAPLGPGAQGWGSLQLRPFGEFAFQAFTAKQSFDAIFGSSTALFYGGGVDLSVARTLRVAVSVTHFQKTGERAFAFNGQSFQLGIPDRVSITPVTFNLVYRFVGSKRFTPYLGGGAGAVIYSETADFAQASDNVSKTGTAFQVVGGVEFPLGSHLSLALEGQYQSVGGVLGDTGVSQSFNESDLGGTSVRVRVLFGK